MCYGHGVLSTNFCAVQTCSYCAILLANADKDCDSMKKNEKKKENRIAKYWAKRTLQLLHV